MHWNWYSHKNATWFEVGYVNIACILNQGTKRANLIFKKAVLPWFHVACKLAFFIATILQHSVDIATKDWFDYIARLLNDKLSKNLRNWLKNKTTRPILLHQYHIATANIATKKQHKVTIHHLSPFSHRKLRSLASGNKFKQLLWVFWFFDIATFLAHWL